MSWFRRTFTREMSAPKQMAANVAAGRDPWHGIANHTRYTPRERLPQTCDYVQVDWGSARYWAGPEVAAAWARADAVEADYQRQAQQQARKERAA